MSGKSLEYGSTQTGPDKSFGDVFVASIEAVQIGLGLPLFEAQLDLPAKAIQFLNEVERIATSRQVGRHDDRLFLAGYHD